MIRTVLLALLVSVTLIAFGCSGANNPAQSSIDATRVVADAGSGGDPTFPPPPPPPVDGPPPPGQFWTGCLSFYHFDFDATLPDGRDKTGPGNLTIFNKDCTTDGADVMVRFMFAHIPVDRRALFIPGTMSATDTGATVTGDVTFQHGDDVKGAEIHETYSLTITGDPATPDQQTITGTLNIDRHIWFTKPNGEKVDKDLTWSFTINGTGAVPPPPKCPGGDPGKNPPPPPPPGGGDPGNNPPPPPPGGGDPGHNPPPPPPPGGGDPGHNPPPPPPPGGGDPGNNPPPLPPDDGGGNG